MNGAVALPRVSVLMPTYKQAHFIARAIDSLCAQTLADWELVVIDDGSPDATPAAVQPYRSDPRLTYLRLDENMGLGAALNVGLRQARAGLIAYLPSDDVYYAEHLDSLVTALETRGAILAYAGVRHHYNREALGQIEGTALQLVQVLHRRVADAWLERPTLVTDDLDRMYWARLRAQGDFAATGRVTAEWVDHPLQRHKLIQEPVGGINRYRTYFQVKHPLRLHSTTGNRMDEVEHYRRFRERPPTPPAADGLKILLVGELAYNPERVLALEERGHTLYGLWTPEPYWYNYVGPLPFGHVTDLPADDWRAAIRRLRPDVIYALLNWQAVPFCHAVLEAVPEIPFIWHFKEGPFICLEKGTWAPLLALYERSAGQIYTSPEMRDWFTTVLPAMDRERTLVLDGDLPKREWFTRADSPRLSDVDGELHTVVPGRPIGLHPHNVAELAQQKIHLHFYGDFTHGQWRQWIEKTLSLAPDHLHTHAQVDQAHWAEEFSRYDAGWLHFFESSNQGDLRRANWDDLNYPARMATLACAGLPMLQRNNHGHRVATQTLVDSLGLGLCFDSMEALGTELRDREKLDSLRQNVLRQRRTFCFDEHADRLVAFMRQIIAGHGPRA